MAETLLLLTSVLITCFIISADVSRGDSKDYSAFHIIDVDEGEVVAEYKGKIPPDDFASTMSIIDSAFTVTGTQAYRVYAIKSGKMSSALTGSISYTVSSAEPTNLSVVPMNNAFYIQYDFSLILAIYK